MSEYEYRVMTRFRVLHEPTDYAVEIGEREAGWTEWSPWVQWTNRSGRKLPYTTLAAARNTARRFKRSNQWGRRDNEVRIQRRPVSNDWEDIE